MNPTLTPTLALTRTGNCGRDAASQHRHLKIIFALNSDASAIHVGTRMADAGAKDRHQPLPEPDQVRKPVAAKSRRDFADRPPVRWGINE